MKILFLSTIYMLGFILVGCNHTEVLTSSHPKMNKMDVRYTISYYIHADSDYLYHTQNGNAVRGNTKVLDTAIDVGSSARSGEVFISYQRSENKLLGLFPRKRSQFYHFRNGQLISKIKYRHTDKEEPFLTTEALLTAQYRANTQAKNHKNYFLYFGHEIPTDNGFSYHHTLPKIQVNETSFTEGIRKILPSDQDIFDLVVLSTCNNGSPEMANLLKPFTHIFLASPQNLHLSHIDSDQLKLIESDPMYTPEKIARSMAEHTFQRLDTTIQSTITLSMYDLQIVKFYLQNLTTITSANTYKDASARFADNIDCSELGSFETGKFSQGIETWYKPARFGRRTEQTSHSGWGCKPNNSR